MSTTFDPGRALRGAPIAMLAVAAALACTLPARAAPVSCALDVPVVPVLDPTATSAELGTLTLDCAGGLTTDPAFAVDVVLFLNVELLGSVIPTLTTDTASYLGIVAANQVQFFGVDIDPLATFMSIEHLGVDPSPYAAGFTYVSFLSTTGATPLLIQNPQQVLGFNGEFAVPEPATAALFLAAALAAGTARRRQTVRPDRT